jgi:hypothetical protein
MAQEQFDERWVFHSPGLKHPKLRRSLGIHERALPPPNNRSEWNEVLLVQGAYGDEDGG